MSDRTTVDRFEGVGKRRHDRKFILKCLGPLCRGQKEFESESKNERVCKRCRKEIFKLAG